MDRRQTLMLRWSLVSAGAIALFWLIWSFFADVPTVTTFIWSNNAWFKLPFGVPRLFDVLLGPLLTCPFVWLITCRQGQKKNFGVYLTVGIFLGIVLALVFCLSYYNYATTPALFGLYVLLNISMILGLCAYFWDKPGPDSNDTFVFDTSLFTSLASAGTIGLISGLIFGIAVWLIFWLGYFVSIGLAACCSFLWSKTAGGKIGAWLLARDKKE